MPVSGLVVSFVEHENLRESAISAIREEPRIEVGILNSRRMAIVVDTTSSEQDKELWHWLTTLPGVAFVDVAMVGFEPAGDGHSLSEGAAIANETPQGSMPHGC